MEILKTIDHQFIYDNKFKRFNIVSKNAFVSLTATSFKILMELIMLPDDFNISIFQKSSNIYVTKDNNNLRLNFKNAQSKCNNNSILFTPTSMKELISKRQYIINQINPSNSPPEIVSSSNLVIDYSIKEKQHHTHATSHFNDITD